MSRSALTAAALALACAACGSAAPPPARPSGASMTVGELLEQHPALQGRTITLSGRFAGWSGRCRGAPPRYRADWMIEDDAHCLYVSGPVPAGIAPPPQKQSNGQPIVLVGTLEHAEDGQPYLLLKPDR